MRSLFFLAAICCLVLTAWAGPIARSEEQDKEVGRQAAAAAGAEPAPAADDDDDDDDDDDGDLDLDDALSEDDDDDDDDDEDDDDEAEDDDDEDYLERFFDDILGGEEDDDDDDETAPVQSVVAPADTVAAAPAPAAEEAAAAAEDAEVAESEATTDVEEPEGGQKEPASAEVEPAASEPAADAEAEEDDDDEDDIADALDPEDDDEDEEEEDDEEDDDDITDALGRNISAKHSRALSTEPAKKPTPVPAIYIVKYNKFVDNILGKMNEILRKSYDPVSVKLQPIDATKKSSKPKNKNKKKTNKRKLAQKKKNTARAGDADKTKEKLELLQTEIPEVATVKKMEDNHVAVENTNVNVEEVENETSESRAVKEKAKPTTNKTKPPVKASKPKPKPKPPTKTTTKKPVTNKNKTKTSSEKNKPRAKGTLYGLSTLRRTGDVAVNIMSDHTTVKSNFAIGPLILRVEKEVGRGAKKELKSATATTAEMTGKLTLRVNNQGVATLHSIKVLQPKQVRVDSNHERTRELVWRRSARIAHVVSEKLRTVSKPMFHYTTSQ